MQSIAKKPPEAKRSLKVHQEFLATVAKSAVLVLFREGASKCLRSAEARPCSEGPRGRYNLTGRGRLGPAALAAGQGAGKKETLRQGS